MQVSVEKINNVECRLTIIVPANQVEEAYSKQIGQLAKNAKIKGFRPGKAPLSYIQKRFGNEARLEAVSEVMQKALLDAIKEKNLKPISTPTVKPKAIPENEPLEFTASFEVLPEIGNIQFSMDNIEKPVVEINEEDIERVIQQLQKQYTKWNVVTRPVQEKDRVVIDYHSIFEGEADEKNKIQQFPLEIGSKTMLPGFEEGLIGANVEETRTLSLSFPTDFGVKERAGKPVDFVVQIKQIFEAEWPSFDEAFIKKIGMASGKEEDLKKQIQQTLDIDRERLIKEKLKEQIFSKLLEQNPIQVPNSLVMREVKSIHDEIYPHEHDHQHSEEEVNAFKEIAGKRVALGLLISEYAKQSNLKPEKERVQKRIQEIATAYEKPQEVIAYLSSNERRAGIEAQVLEDEVLEKLMTGVQVTEKTMNYADLKGGRK